MQEVYIRKTIYEFFTKMTENIKEGKTMEILERISQTEWEATPESVKQLVKKLIGTLEVMVPK